MHVRNSVDIRAIEKNSALYDEKNFEKRVEAIDFIEFHVLDRIENLLQETSQPNKLILLKSQAEKLKSDLENLNSRLFTRLRENIRVKGTTREDIIQLIMDHVYFNLIDNELSREAGYDHLDIFINELFAFQHIPAPTKELEPGMIFYQKTPARIVFEIAANAAFSKNDIFFDLGSGLGQLTILIHLLTGIKVTGVEYEPAFCDYARNIAEELYLSDVRFLNGDARQADYSKGTIFFMFTPFRGEIMQDVLGLLKKQAVSRKIKIIGYGPCSAKLALQDWLYALAPNEQDMYQLQFFESF